MSYDPVSILAEFAKDATITYPLLSDRGSKTIDAYDIRNEKARGGLPVPMTFLIDQSGTIRGKLPGTTRKRHSVDELLKVAAKLPPARPKIAWNAPPEEWQWVIAENIPGMVHGTVDSSSMKRKVGYNVYLPPSYRAESENRFPVVYYLHGAGGSERSALEFGDVVRAAIKDGEIREAIWVFPNGGHFSGYRDWKDKNVKSSTLIVKELIPQIDANYRTIANRTGRAVCGFSMGGGGAIRFALQYPDLFCAAASLAGAFAKNDEAKDGANVFAYAEANVASLRQRMGLYLVCGEKDRLFARQGSLVDRLKKLAIRHEFVSHPGIGHNLGDLKKLSGRQLVKAIDRELHKAE